MIIWVLINLEIQVLIRSQINNAIDFSFPGIAIFLLNILILILVYT